jgi:hypothetical protein
MSPRLSGNHATDRKSELSQCFFCDLFSGECGFLDAPPKSGKTLSWVLGVAVAESSTVIHSEHIFVVVVSRVEKVQPNITKTGRSEITHNSGSSEQSDTVAYRILNISFHL